MSDQRDENVGDDTTMLSVDEGPRVTFSLRLRKPLKEKFDKLNKTQKAKLIEKLEKVIACELYKAEFDFDKFVKGKDAE